MSIFCLFFLKRNVYAQPVEPTKAVPKQELEELRLTLNDDGSHFIKATFLNQVWLRCNESNPGTTVLGQYVLYR